jgi:alcohol dehydrogenase (NADP+)
VPSRPQLLLRSRLVTATLIALLDTETNTKLEKPSRRYSLLESSSEKKSSLQGLFHLKCISFHLQIISPIYSVFPLCSKLWLSNCHPELVEAALKKTLADLRLTYLDLYLIHWPFFMTKDSVFPAPFENRLGYNKDSYLAIWRELEKAVDAGLIKAIGTSNMSAKKLYDLLQSARIPPSVNQVELHPFLASNELLAWCTKKGIVLTGYSPLGSPDRPKRLMEDGDPAPLFDETIIDIAKAHGKEPAQVLIRWAIQRGTVSIPKSITPSRIEANGKVFDFTLSEEDMARIGKLNNNQRLIKGLPMVKENQPWVELWDLDFDYNL